MMNSNARGFEQRDGVVFVSFDQLSDTSLWAVGTDGSLAHFQEDFAGMRTASSQGMWTPTRLISPRLPLGFAVKLLRVSPSGTCALVAGYDNLCPHLTVASVPQTSSMNGQIEKYNHISCRGDFIFNRSGMELNDISWWPGDDPSHFVVLSGNCLAIYNARSLSVPTATYRLHMSQPQIPRSLQEYGTAVSLTFIRNAKGWNAFTICILLDGGRVLLMCPVFVPGMVCDAMDVKYLVNREEGSREKTWLGCVFSGSTLSGILDDGQNHTIMTRDQKNARNLVPALQFPESSSRPTHKQSFTSIVSLGNDVFAIGSACGTIRFLKISPASPAFVEGNRRNGAPHLLELSDCHRVQSPTKIELLREVPSPLHDVSVAQLIFDSTRNRLAVVGKSHTMLIDVTTADSVIMKTPTGSFIGSISVNNKVFYLQKTAHFHLQYSVLRLAGEREIGMQKQPVLPPRSETEGSALVESEDALLESIAQVRERSEAEMHSLRMTWEKQQALDQQRNENPSQQPSRVVSIGPAMSVATPEMPFTTAYDHQAQELRTLIQEGGGGSASSLTRDQIKKRLEDVGLDLL